MLRRAAPRPVVPVAQRPTMQPSTNMLRPVTISRPLPILSRLPQPALHLSLSRLSLNSRAFATEANPANSQDPAAEAKPASTSPPCEPIIQIVMSTTKCVIVFPSRASILLLPLPHLLSQNKPHVACRTIPQAAKIKQRAKWLQHVANKAKGVPSKRTNAYRKRKARNIVC